MKKFFVGCGVVVVLLIGLGVFGLVQFGQWAQRSLPDFEAFGQRRAELVEAYGPEDAYVPPVDGAYDPARVALYVDLRELLWPGQQEIAREIDGFLDRELSGEGGGIGGFVSQMKAAFGTVGLLARHAAVTDSLLLEHEMGRGEFTHLQLILTRGWMDLGRERAEWERLLADAPPGDDGLQAMLEIHQAAERRAAELLQAHRRNLMDAASAPLPDSVAVTISMEGDRLPFVDPVPPRLDAAFDDHAVRLRMTRPKTLGAWLAETPALLQEETFDESRTRRVRVEF